MAFCPAFEPNGPYLGNVLAYVDCQALSLGEAGYRALGSGSPFGMALTGLLTIFVALIGYRLLVGGEVTVRETVTTALKLGIVLALATQWSAFRVVVFDVATRTPELAAGDFLSPAGLGNQGSAGIAARIDGVNAALAELLEQSAAAVRNAQLAAPAQPPGMAPPQPAPAQPQARVLPAGAEKSLDSAMAVLAVSALAGFLSVRVILALLLALAPAFLAAMLFDASRGFFIGWLRVVAGTALAALAVPVVLALQLSIVEPQVLALRAAIDANQPLAAMPQQVLGTAAVFALVMLASFAAVVRVAMGLQLPAGRLRESAKLAGSERQLALPPPEWFAGEARAQSGALTRAQVLANAAQTQDWRGERMREASLPPLRLALPHAELPGTTASEFFQAAMPLGQEGRRHSQRRSAGADRRDEVR